MPAITVHNYASEIQTSVHQLKVERDTWQAVALKYKSAFESQTNRLQELQGVCFAAQAELENERAQQRKLHATSERTTRLNTMDGTEEPRPAQTFGMATVFHQRQTSDMCTNPLFHGVQRCINERNYGTAIVELERLLRGPLSPKARAEGLLLKSSVLRAAGPEELLDALAACSEALELCDRLSDLETFLPRIQYQRGVLFYQLRMLHQARDAFSAVNNDDLLSATANEYRSSCDEEIRLHNAGNRRSGFDEDRSFDEGLVVQLDEKLDASCVR
jgi:putative pyruvate formate lyase activating enzyme